MTSRAKSGGPARLLAALALLLLCAWAVNQAARLGWASFQAIEARALLKRAMEGSGAMNAQNWSRARSGLLIALEWDPDNPEYHQAMADLYLLRLMRVQGDRSKMTPYFEVALQHFHRAAALRPTWPFSHAGIVVVKQQMGRIDADFKHALVMASRYGPWEAAVQDQLIVAGFGSWSALDEPAREIIRGNLRRAHQSRPQQSAALLAALKPLAPPCGQLAVHLPNACAAPVPTAPTAPRTPGAAAARKGAT